MFDKWAFYKSIGYDVHHDEVRRFHESKAKIKVCVAPRRTTKSYSASYDVLPDFFEKPGCRGWIVGPTYSLAEKEFNYIHKALTIDMGMKAIHNNPKQQKLIFSGNRIIEGKSAENPSSLLGEALDWVIYSEAAELPRGIRERYVAPALNTKRGREIIPTTPQARAEWVHELWLAGQGGEFSEIETFQWDRSANPLYDESEFLRAKKFYGEDSPIFREQYLGQWVFYGGIVYPMFSEEHIIDPFEIPKGWKIVRGIDFGFRDPFVTLWVAIGPHAELYLFKEYYCREGRSLREHALHIRTQSEGMNISMSVGDPSEAQAIEDLAHERVYCEPANNDRHAGRLRVAEYLTPTDDANMPFNVKIAERAKYPRLYIMKNCVETLRELRYYRWKEGRHVEGDAEKTEGEDHAMDTLRYICMTRPSPMKYKSRVVPGTFNHVMGKIREAKQSLGGIR